MARITDVEVEAHRAEALLYIAFPQYRVNGAANPMYWDRRLAGSVDSQGFASSAFSTAALARHFRGKIPPYIIDQVANEMGFTPDDVKSFPPEDILAVAVGKHWFEEAAAEYLRKSWSILRQDMHGRVPMEAIDRYALQLMEEATRAKGTAKVSHFRVTASKKDSHVGVLDIPAEKGGFVGTYKFGFGDPAGQLSKDMVQFVGDVLPVVWGNLNAYADRIDPGLAVAWRHDLRETEKSL